MNKNILFIAILLLFVNVVYAQQYRFEHLYPNEGNPHNLTYSILQDSDGFMWFGTFYGLIRYDGRDLTVFKHFPYDTNSVSSEDIISLYEDKQGYIWIGTWSGGLNRFDPDTEKFHTFVHDPNDSLSISNDVVYSVCEDGLGRLWVATDNGLNRFVPLDDPENIYNKPYFVRYYHDPDNRFSIKKNSVRALYKDSQNRFWVGVFGGGLHYYNLFRDNFIRLEDDIEDDSNRIVSIFEDDNNILWLATRGGGVKRVEARAGDTANDIKISTQHFKHDPRNSKSISSNYIWDIEQDKYGNLWVGTSDGLNVFDLQKNTFERFYNDPKNSNTISSNEVSTIKLDQSGVLWIGTFRGGIDRIVPSLAQFEYFYHNPFDPNSIIDKEITALLEDRKKNIWVGTVGGITKISKTAGNYVYENIQFESTNATRKMDNYITALLEDFRGNIWVGTHNGLNCIHKDGTISRYNLPILPGENELGNIVTSLLLDSKGHLWVGTITHGLNLFNLYKKKFTSFRHNSADTTSISSNYVVSIYESEKGDIWVGTYNGLNKINADLTDINNPRITFKKDLKTQNGNYTINKFINCIYEDNKNSLWIGTNEGLIEYNFTAKVVKIYDEANGLPDNQICGILEDKDNHLWVSTQKGLFTLNTVDKSLNSYYILHAAQGNVFNVGAYFKSKDGKMMYGSLNGFNAFYPENITRFEYIPPVVLTSFSVFDEEKNFDKRLSEVSKIELTYEENFFTIKFASLDFRQPERNQYYYFLEGFDRNWIYNENKNYASYTNLDPGEYIFRVRGSNSNGIWNNEGHSITLIISPPFWQTWWFQTLISIVVLILLLLIIYMIQRNERKKTTFNKRISELKLQALRAQMNPHFIFNTINSIQYFISCNDQESAFLYLSKFSKLMRQTLENSAKSRISIERELEALTLYMDLQKLRFEKKFDYSIDVDPEIDTHSYEIPTMLIQPYIENAINHGISKKRHKGYINVQIRKVDNNLSCTVVDNGIGINKSMALKNKNNSEHTSSGMRLTSNRLEIINDGKNENANVSVVDLKTENEKLNGTKVTINIPLQISNN